MSIEEYDPKSTLVVPEHHPQKAKYPFIDVHNHQDRDITAEDAAKLVSEMDRIGMRVMVNLSGGRGEEFIKGQANLAGPLSRAVSSSSPTSTSRGSSSRAGASGRPRSSRRTSRPARGA